jgi:L-aspartate oxidase
VHGANRLASTSLLEGLTWGYYAAQSIREKLASPSSSASASVHRAFSSLGAGMGSYPDAIVGSIPDWKAPGRQNLEDPALILQDWTIIQHTTWNYVGIVRTVERLKRAVADMQHLGNRLTKYYHESTISKSIVELFHGQQMAAIVANAAIRNPRSIGAHLRRDS